jgi:hypothetical protein
MKTVKKSLLRLALVLAVLAALCCTAFAIENYHVSSQQELTQVLGEQLENRVTNFSVTYDGDYLDLVDRYINPDLTLLLRQAAATLPDADGSGPDYNTLNIKEAAAGVLDHVLYFSFTYFTSQKQEQALDAQCAAILKSLDLDGQSDYAKVRTIYEYVGTELPLRRHAELRLSSPYFGLKTGTMVCQGYSLLLTKLLWLAGVPNRILIGDGGGEPHSWNIVKLNGSWYDLDVTWDAAQRIGQAMTWNFFLRGSANFPAHTAADAYQAYSFASQYPVSSSDYDAPRITLSIKGSAVQSLILRLNTPVQLVSSGSGCTFVSTDPSIVSVDQNGNLTARRTGDCSIIARTADRSVVPGMLTIRTVDLTSASSWASSAVNAYYLRGLLPAEFCTGFQKAVTRAEMARYLYQLCAYELDLSKLEVSYVYRDIGDSDYADAILACTALGLFSGTGENTFSPDAPVTREQAAKLLVRTMELLTGQKLDASANPGYTDAAKISGWASSCVSAATAAGLMRGDSRGRFSPASGITREQLTVVLERICRTLDAQQKAAA